MDIKDLESEYTEFIGNQQYGTPIAFAKCGQTREEQDIENYFYQHGQFKACCVPCGCCPPPMCCVCWICFFPIAIYSWFSDRVSEEKVASDAQSTRNVRYVLFPTMIVKLKKYSDNNAVFEKSKVIFSHYRPTTCEVVENIDDNMNDGLIGCIQNCLISAISGINVFGTETRYVFTGGNRSRLINYETLLVPESRMIIPINEAKRFASVLEETLTKFRNREYNHSLDQVESSQPSSR